MKKILHLALACVALLSLMPHPALFAPAATSTVVVPEFNKNRHILAHVALFAALHLAQIGYNGMLHLRQGYGGQATPATKNPANRTLKQRAAQAAANTKAFLKALATLQSYKNYGAELKAILPTPTKTGTKLSAKQWAQAVLAGTKIFIKNHQIVSLGLPLQFILGGGYTWLTRNAHLAGLAERAADQARLNAEFEKQERETAAGIKLVKIGKKFMKGFKFRKVVQQAKEAAAKAKADKVIKIQSAYRQRLARKQLEKRNKIKNSSIAKKLKRKKWLAALKTASAAQKAVYSSLRTEYAQIKNKVFAEVLNSDYQDYELVERCFMGLEDKYSLRKSWDLTERNIALSQADGTPVLGFREGLVGQVELIVSHLPNDQVILETPQERAARLQPAPTATPTPPPSGEEDEEDGDDADNGSGSDTPVHTPKPAEVPEPDDVPQADDSGDDDVEPVTSPAQASEKTFEARVQDHYNDLMMRGKQCVSFEDFNEWEEGCFCKQPSTNTIFKIVPRASVTKKKKNQDKPEHPALKREMLTDPVEVAAAEAMFKDYKPRLPFRLLSPSTWF